jgi:hypothetical protein
MMITTLNRHLWSQVIVAVPYNLGSVWSSWYTTYRDQSCMRCACVPLHWFKHTFSIRRQNQRSRYDFFFNSFFFITIQKTITSSKTYITITIATIAIITNTIPLKQESNTSCQIIFLLKLIFWVSPGTEDWFLSFDGLGYHHNCSFIFYIYFIFF